MGDKSQLAFDIAKNLASAGIETAKSIVKSPIALSMIPVDLASNIVAKQPLPPLKVPFLGEVKSYSRRALDYQKEAGYTPWTAAVRAASEGFADVASAGSLAQSVFNTAGTPLSVFGKKPMTVEAMSEQAGGWKSGVKEQFDKALLHKDKTAIENLLPDVPSEYKQRFAKDITNITGNINEQVDGIIKNPSSVRIFRGENPANGGGIHWTTDPEWAKNFGDVKAQTLPKDATVHLLVKSDVEEALNNGAKNEKEVVQYLFNKGYDAIIGTDSRNGLKVDLMVNPIKNTDTVAKVGQIITDPKKILSKFKPPVSALDEMANFTEYIHSKVPNPVYEADIRDMASKFAIDPNQSNKKLAEMFSKILDAAKYSELLKK